MKRLNKRGISPLFATILLIVFAIAIGAVVMAFGKDYVSELSATPTEQLQDVCSVGLVSEPLKELQVRYINNEITKEEYLDKEKQIIG